MKTPSNTLIKTSRLLHLRLRRLLRIFLHIHRLLLRPLHALPLHKHGPQQRRPRRRNRNRKHIHQRIIIRVQPLLPIRRGDLTLELRGAGRRERLRIHPGDPTQPLRELIIQNILRHADENRAAEPLGEKHDGDTHIHVGLLQHRLRRKTRLLQPQADAKGKQHLHADPHGMRGMRGKQLEEARANSAQHGRRDDKGGIIADFLDGDAGADGGDDEREHEGDDHDAGVGGGDALDGLEPDGQPVGDGHEARPDHEGDPEAGGDGAVLEDADGDGGVFALEDLVDGEADEEEAGEDEEDDDARVAPVVGGPAPLESQ